MSGFENINILLAEPNVQIRRTVSDSLRQHGYHSIRDTGQTRVVREAVSEDRLDVLITDVTLEGEDMCELLYGIRHHRAGTNPFLVTMALTENPSVDVVRKVVNSGADDVLLKPVSVKQILDRLGGLSKNRKGFVVTTDYIGPDRRKNGARPGTQEIPVFNVPNPLLYKRSDSKADLAQVQAAINAAARIINEQKMERHAFQVQYLVDEIVPRYSIGDVDANLKGMVRRLVFVSEDLVRRMRGTDREHVRELGESMIKVAQAVHRNVDAPNIRDLHLLPELSSAIKKAFDADEKTAALAHDISTSVGRIA
ncbi:response regulator [Magnetovibrio sp. PR-2]|uniref:response regulator transcription factor n=1 Tax=Magnetovibrio sp. PR-2 TaxID=3120356 RepID=UPI002FCDE25B